MRHGGGGGEGREGAVGEHGKEGREGREGMGEKIGGGGKCRALTGHQCSSLQTTFGCFGLSSTFYQGSCVLNVFPMCC